MAISYIDHAPVISVPSCLHSMQAVFVVGIDGMQLGMLQQPLAQAWHSNDSTFSVDVEKLSSMLFLRAVFAVRQGSAAPSLSLHIPRDLETVIGGQPTLLLFVLSALCMNDLVKLFREAEAPGLVEWHESHRVHTRGPG